MANQTVLLRLTANPPGRKPGAELTLDELCQLYAPGKPYGARTALRRQVINAMGKLLEKKLVSIIKPTPTKFNDVRWVKYQATAEGIARAADKKPLVGGPTRKRSKLPKVDTDTVRQRLWEALRLQRKATAAELAELVHQKGDAPVVKVIKNCHYYFVALERAGIIAKLAVRAKGFAPTSPGRTRYALVRDLGPLAPCAGRHCVTDQNARERIEYRKKEKADA